MSESTTKRKDYIKHKLSVAASVVGWSVVCVILYGYMFRQYMQSRDSCDCCDSEDTHTV